VTDELLDLVHRYATYADARRLDDLAALFTEDGTLVTPGGAFEGRDAIRAHLGVLERIERTIHLITTTEFTVAGDATAAGLIAAEAHHINGDSDHVWTLRYLDTYSSSSAAPRSWRFERREIDLISTADRPVTPDWARLDP
jgi:uncharacterized protein (TIGR02246 family)